jgi:uncharacterized membrane protein YcaP (DUF421 family)
MIHCRGSEVTGAPDRGSLMLDLVNQALGLDAQTLGVVQMTLRAAIVYFVALAFVRIGDKRFLGKNTAFDVVIAIMFGSVMSRAITSGPDLVPILAAGGVLVALHFGVALLTFRSERPWLSSEGP